MKIAVIPSNQHLNDYAGFPDPSVTEESVMNLLADAAVVEFERQGYQAKKFWVPGAGLKSTDELGRMLSGNKPARPRQHTGGEERSRIWNDYVAKVGLQALAAPMPEIGAELWIDFCQQLSPGPGLPPAKLPAVPSGVSLEHLRAKWPFTTGL